MNYSTLFTQKNGCISNVEFLFAMLYILTNILWTYNNMSSLFPHRSLTFGWVLIQYKWSIMPVIKLTISPKKIKNSGQSINIAKMYWLLLKKYMFGVQITVNTWILPTQTAFLYVSFKLTHSSLSVRSILSLVFLSAYKVSRNHSAIFCQAY